MDDVKLLQQNGQLKGFNIYQLVLDLVTDKGAAYLQQYQFTKDKRWLEEAIRVFKNGHLFLTRIKATQALQFSSNLVWRLSAHAMYEKAIEACYAKGDMDAAFYFFEESRAVLLSDQINEQSLLPEKSIALAAQTDQEISQLLADLQNPTNPPLHPLDLLKKLYAKSTERQRLSQQLNRQKASAALAVPAAIDLTIATARLSVLDGGSLLEIFTGDSAVYVLSIATGKKSLQKLDKSIYDSLSHSFISLLSHAAIYQADVDAYLQTSHPLYSLLFNNQAPAPGRLVISTDAGFFPFEALVINEKNQPLQYFIEKYAVSYTYSARYLSEATINDSKGNSLLGVAPVFFAPSLQLASLPGSDASLEYIKSYFGNANNRIKEQATRQNFLQQFPDYDIIQLYTHAADSSNRNEPVIYFADSALYLSQLISERKPIAKLIVLSACETANGRLYQGEGVFSFNRGFAALGIPAAISNCWSVDNESTYRLNGLFYQFLAQGLETDKALRQAKLAFLRTASKEKQYPYYWAASVLVGKNTRIVAAGVKPIYFLALATVLFTLGCLLYLYFRRK